MRNEIKPGLRLSVNINNFAIKKLLYISCLVLLIASSLFFVSSCQYGTPETKLSGPVDDAWTKVFDVKGNQYNSITDIKFDDEGNIYIVAVGSHHNDFFIVKYSNEGKKLWDNHYRGREDYVGSIKGQLCIDRQGDIYVVGGSYSLRNIERDGTKIIRNLGGFTAKYNQQGEEIWLAENTIGADSIAVDDEGSVLITGEWGTIKYDDNGSQLWQKDTGGVEIAVDGEQNVYILAGTEINKYDANGDVIWQARFESASDMALDNLGNAYIAGSASDACMTAKYDKDGREVWVASYKNPSDRYDDSWIHWRIENNTTAVAIDASGDVYVSGESGGDYATVKYDNNGNELWVGLYGIPENNEVKSHANDICLDDAGNIYVTGYGGDNCTTVKYNSEGVRLWSADYYGGITARFAEASAGFVIATDAAGNVYVGGETYVKSRFDGSANQYYSKCLFIKYISE